MSTAIVTGASRGLGFAVARELAAAGWNLVIDARDNADLLNAAGALSEIGSGKVEPITGDVVDERHAVSLVEAAAAIGDFTLLINNASLLGPSPQPTLAAYPIGVYERVIAVNLVAPLRLIQLALPYLRRVRGTVINVTSDAAVEPYPGWGGYGSSKAGLEQLSNVLGAEETEVHVYWIDPGDMRTRMQQEAFPDEDVSDRPAPETRAPALISLIEGDHPSGRYQAEHLLTEQVVA